MNLYTNVEHSCVKSLNMCLEWNWIRLLQEVLNAQRSRHDIWWQFWKKKQPNMNKCFGIQLKLHDISWWLARIFIHVQWTMDFIYLWQQKKNCMHLYADCICEMVFLAILHFGLFFTSPIQSIENKTLEHS